jgi:transposase
MADAGWGMLLAQLSYKTSWSEGSLLCAADRFYPSSKMCSSCGAVKAKLRLAERVFTCDNDACGHVQDRDLNAALNLARMADRHARTEGIYSYVARTGRFTKTARGGQVSLVGCDQHSPVKREASRDVPAPGGAGSHSWRLSIQST